MHPAAYQYVADAVARLPQRPRSVVEIGSRFINGGIRSLFRGAAYTGIDIVAGPGVDIVADGATWQPPAPVDVVVCCEVLEHTPKAPLIIANAARMLTPGGCLIVTAAGPGRAPHSAIEGGPLRKDEYYRNVTHDELHYWLHRANFNTFTIDTDEAAGDIRAVAGEPVLVYEEVLL